MKMDKATYSNVTGTTPMDVTQGEAIRVSNASYDAGYLPEVKSEHEGTMAELIRGHCGYDD